MNFADAEYTINEVKRLQKYDKRREGFIPPSVKIQEIERKSDTVKIKYRLDISDDDLKAMIKGKDGIGVYSNGVRLSKILGVKIYIKNWSSNNHFNQDITPRYKGKRNGAIIHIYQGNAIAIYAPSILHFAGCCA